MIRNQVSIPAFAKSYLATMGIDTGEVLRLAKLPVHIFQGGKVWVTTQEYFAIWQAIEKSGAPADLGLKIGMSGPPPGKYDVASIAALHSANFGEAIAKVARYKRMVCPALWTLETEGTVARLSIRWLLCEDEVPTLVTDGALAYVVSLFARGTGQSFSPICVELTRRRANEPMLARYFGCDVKFDRPEDCLVFESRLLNKPFLTHNPELLDLMVPSLETALYNHAAEPSWADLTTQAIRRIMQGRRPSIAAVAAELCVSARTLQRHLSQAGTTYQQSLDQARHEVAGRLLETTDMPADDIAFLLGFEELNSFTRAFQRWVGNTPNQWRASRDSRRCTDDAGVQRRQEKTVCSTKSEELL
ncbi:MAG: AraC family transcriptional regulator [Luteimonas sp.]|nr:AraC family transcriptional regulator [Luteimonas sp.]